MIVRNEKELKILREGGKRLAEILRLVSERVSPGVKTMELDAYAEELIMKCGGKPSFKGYKVHGAPRAYPATLCVSINDEIVHGIPSPRLTNDGDIVGLDIGMLWGGLYTDAAVTVPAGNVSDRALKLIQTTKKSLDVGIAAIHTGARIGDIGCAIQRYVESKGFSVVKELVGHGVGKKVHEDPEVPNWGARGDGMILKEGTVLALEPMVIDGSDRIKLDDDGWTWRTRDGALSAHFEHTVVVTKKGAEVITK